MLVGVWEWVWEWGEESPDLRSNDDDDDDDDDDDGLPSTKKAERRSAPPVATALRHQFNERRIPIPLLAIQGNG